jgi:hypothetical protein
MGTVTQQRAKSMSESYLNGGKSTIYSNDINMVKELADYFGNKSNARQDQMYQRQLQDSKDWAERSAQVAEGTQRRSLRTQENIAGIQATGQVQSATASAAPNMYNAQSQRIGAIGQVSKAGGTEFAKSLMDPFYRPNIQKMDEEAFNEKAEAAADKAFRGTSSGGFVGGGSSYGMNGTIDPYDYNVGSTLTSRTFNASKLADFNFLQGNIARNNAMFSEANAAGDIARDKAQAQNQAYLASVNQRNQIETINRQAFIEAQRGANDYRRLSKESAAERASRERGQAMDAQSKIYSSMFNSFSGGGNQNYQYWGGKV